MLQTPEEEEIRGEESETTVQPQEDDKDLQSEGEKDAVNVQQGRASSALQDAAGGDLIDDGENDHQGGPAGKGGFLAHALEVDDVSGITGLTLSASVCSIHRQAHAMHHPALLLFDFCKPLPSHCQVHTWDSSHGTLPSGTHVSKVRDQDVKNVLLYDWSRFTCADEAGGPHAIAARDPAVEDDEPCYVCLQADEGEVLLLCEQCERPAHKECVGLRRIPKARSKVQCS